MNKETLTITPPLRYFLISNVHFALLIGACFLFKGRFEEYISVAIVIFILLLFFKLALNYLHYLSIRFIITEERVISEFGFFNTKVDYLEMYRIYDYQINRSLLQKIFNMMNIYLITRDVTSPVLKMQGISFNSELIDTPLGSFKMVLRKLILPLPNASIESQDSTPQITAKTDRMIISDSKCFLFLLMR